MVGDGNGVLKIPTNSKFITVINNTSYTVTVYGSVGTILDSNVEFEFPAFSALCYPVDTVAGELTYTIAWSGGVTPDYFDVLLTDYNTNIYISFPQAGASNISIVTDTVGLARTGQLPTALTADGNLKVGVNEDLTQLPATLTADGNLKVGVSEDLTQLPASLSGYGGVKVTLFGISGYTWHKLTFTEAGDSATIGGSDMTLVGWECSGTATAYPLAGTQQAWKSLNKKDFALPIRVGGGAFKMHADAACDVWVCVR